MISRINALGLPASQIHSGSASICLAGRLSSATDRILLPSKGRAAAPSVYVNRAMRRIVGLETEYGITIDGADSVDVVAESIELVRGYTEHGAHMKWDYDLEDPHQDARGFRAAELLQDTDESAYFEIDRNRPLSFEEIKSDLVLSNGARFYNDHAHPEYSTPECTTLRELVAQDKAGERILAECARRRNLKLPNRTGGATLQKQHRLLGSQLRMP